MELKSLAISLCHSNCPKCGISVDYKMFESGAGGDFITYVGSKSGSIYRLDYTKVIYGQVTLEKALEEAVASEGRLIEIPQEIHCNFCGEVFSAKSAMIDSEQHIDAYEL